MRFDNWPELLVDSIKTYSDTPFEWGVHDCCLFPMNIVKLFTSIDYAEYFRGNYSSEKEAYNLLKEFGGGGIEETAHKLFGKDIPVLTIQRGDVCTIQDPVYTIAAGICVGNKIAVAKSPKGVGYMPLPAIRKAWRIN